MNANMLLIEQLKPGVVWAPAVGAAGGNWLSLKGYERVTFFILAKNATTVTGSAITVRQATAIAGTGDKAVSFTKAYRNIDLAVNQQLAEFAVSSDTFTLDSTNSKDLLYAVEVSVDQLDVKNNFDVVRLVTAVSVAQTIAVLAVLWPGKYGGITATSPTVD